jgi:hypothetical protein
MATPALFLPVVKVITRMQLNEDLEGISEVLNSAIVGAQLHIESVLGTKLLARAHNCKYFLDSDAFSGLQPDGRYCLEVPSYFVRTDTPLLLTYGYKWNSTIEGVVDMTSAEVDHEKGHIYVDANFGDKYVQIQCSTGFIPETREEAYGAETITPAEPLPDWLEESILSYVGVIMDVSQTTNRNADAASIYTRAGDHAMAVLAPNMRKRGFVFRKMG